MIGGRKPKGKLLGKRNGINVYAPTEKKPRVELKTKTPMKLITPKQKEKNKNWRQITDELCEEEHYICRWCGLVGTRDFNDLNRLEGHHIIPRRYNIHTRENCYPSHNQTCHDFITDNSIDVSVCKTKVEWENREK